MSYCDQDPYIVYAFYHFTELNDLNSLVKKWQKELGKMGMKGRIYLHKQGVNAQCSIARENKDLFEEWLKSDPRFKDVFLKLHSWKTNAFERLNIRERPYLVSMDEVVNPEDGADHISPEKWSSIIDEKDDDTIILDVRNQYEYELGHFEGAIAPKCKTFREYLPFIEELKKTRDVKKTRVLMSCTGGIRCELFSPLMKQAGFEKVYQLDGGVINYGNQMGNTHWKGKLFVFDDRLSIDICDKKSESIAPCSFCENSCDDVYNCANMDCNKMFFACPQCMKTHQGCCQASCSEAPRTRPLSEQNPHKPFRRWYNYRQEKQILPT